MPSSDPYSVPEAIQDLFEHEHFVSILKYYLDLNCFVFSTEPGTNWLAVNYHQRYTSLYDIEKEMGYRLDWSLVTDPAFEAAHAPGEPLLVENCGFYDIFAPIRRKGKRIGTILCGAFAKEEVTYPHLRESWRKLGGREPSSESADFRRFARIMLATPVLERPVTEAFQEAMEIFARGLVHGNHAKDISRLDELTFKVFSKRMPHSYWMKWALGLPTLQATPTWSLELEKMGWVREEIGVTRVPTTVLTAIPTNPSGKKTDVVEEMVRIYHFQRRSFNFAKTLPQTTAGNLEDYGAVFITSADPSLSRPQRRRQILETAQKIHRFAEETLGGPALVGIGVSVSPGEALNDSFRQAVLALHLGRGSGQKCVFFTPVRSEKREGVLGLMQWLTDLKKSFESSSFAGLELLLDGYLKQVLTLSFQNPEEIRWHLQYGLFQLRETIRNRTDLGKKEFDAIYERLVLTLENAGTTQEMVSAFKAALEKMPGLTQDAGSIQENYSIEKIRDLVKERFREPLRLSRLAKSAGVSPSTLSRRFKSVTGGGLEAYLRDLRLEEARRLLKTGSLPISQIARACGFKSCSYFTRFFSKSTGYSPQAFRKRS